MPTRLAVVSFDSFECCCCFCCLRYCFFSLPSSFRILLIVCASSIASRLTTGHYKHAHLFACDVHARGPVKMVCGTSFFFLSRVRLALNSAHHVQCPSISKRLRTVYVCLAVGPRTPPASIHRITHSCRQHSTHHLIPFHSIAIAN